MKKYALFIGRWQTWHEGHEWLIRQQLDKDKNCWIAIRDVEVNQDNPLSSLEVMESLTNNPFIIEHRSKILLTIIPDIESINYGRNVGYDIIYHEPPEYIKEISGAKIRGDKK